MEDALAALDLLRSRQEVASGMRFLLGHSPGGMLVPDMALRDGSLAGVAILGAPGGTGLALNPRVRQVVRRREANGLEVIPLGARFGDRGPRFSPGMWEGEPGDTIGNAEWPSGEGPLKMDANRAIESSPWGRSLRSGEMGNRNVRDPWSRLPVDFRSPTRFHSQWHQTDAHSGRGVGFFLFSEGSQPTTPPWFTRSVTSV